MKINYAKFTVYKTCFTIAWSLLTNRSALESHSVFMRLSNPVSDLANVQYLRVLGGHFTISFYLLSRISRSLQFYNKHSIICLLLSYECITSDCNLNFAIMLMTLKCSSVRYKIEASLSKIQMKFKSPKLLMEFFQWTWLLWARFSLTQALLSQAKPSR